MKRLVVGISTMGLICVIGAGSIYAAAESNQFQPHSGAFPMKGDRQKIELTEEQKAEILKARAEREIKEAAFVQTLTIEQKALYEATRPAAPVEGEKSIKIDESLKKEMKAKHDEFMASLSETQKTAYSELFGKMRMELTEVQKAEMDKMRAEREEKEAGFLETLTAEQKALYEAMRPEEPTEGEQKVKINIYELKEKHEAFLESLTESQKAAFDELFGKRERPEKIEV